MQKVKILIVLIFLFSAGLIYGQNCKFDENGFRSVPWGHIQSIIDLGEVKSIRGKILAPNEEEIVDVRIVLYKIEGDKDIFIGSQLSDENGDFCFKGIKKGNYELRMGMDGFNSRIYKLQLNPKNKRLSNKIEARLELGT